MMEKEEGLFECERAHTHTQNTLIGLYRRRDTPGDGDSESLSLINKRDTNGFLPFQV